MSEELNWRKDETVFDHIRRCRAVEQKIEEQNKWNWTLEQELSYRAFARFEMEGEHHGEDERAATE
jgi:hypothetical protein